MSANFVGFIVISLVLSASICIAHESAARMAALSR